MQNKSKIIFLYILKLYIL